MDISELKNILQDRVKTAYAIAFILMAIFAYLLLVQYDVGIFFKFRSNVGDAEANLETLHTASGYQSYIADFNSLYINDENANWLIETITKFAENENVKLKLIKPLAAGNIAEYKVVRVLVEGKSQYADLLRFVRLLENNKKRLFVEELNINTPSFMTQQIRGNSQFFMQQNFAGSPGADESGQLSQEQMIDMEQPQTDEEGLLFKLVVSFFSR